MMTNAPAGVQILATRLRDGWLDATLLVFRTIRVGFPTLPVTVWTNALDPETHKAVVDCADSVKATVRPIPRQIAHDAWVEALLANCPTPFWIADTDLVFNDAVERFASAPMTGRLEPAFLEPWSGTQHVERLHTSLLYLDPQAIRDRVRVWESQWHPKGFPFRPITELVRQTYVPVAGKPPLFYDTCAALYHAIGGVAFTPEQDAVFNHLHCSTYVQAMSESIPGLKDAHARIYAQPKEAGALPEQQRTFYTQHAIQ